MNDFCAYMCQMTKAFVILCALFVCGVPSVHAVEPHTSSEQEALRVLSKHKALFSLIPPRVAQVLKVVRLHSHAAPAQRLDIVHGTLSHVRDKYRIVQQLRDTVKQARKALEPSIRTGITEQFRELNKQLKNYLGTLTATVKVLDDEVSKLTITATGQIPTARRGRAHIAARDVLAPNHIDNLVDTLAGHDRAVATDDGAVNAGLSGELHALREQIAQMNQTLQGRSIGTVALQATPQQDFSQAMADMSAQHSAATITPTVKIISLPAAPISASEVHVPQQLVPTLEPQSPQTSMIAELSTDFVGAYRALKNGTMLVMRTAISLFMTSIKGLYTVVVNSVQATYVAVVEVVRSIGVALNVSAYTRIPVIKAGVAATYHGCTALGCSILNGLKNSGESLGSAISSGIASLRNGARTAGHSALQGVQTAASATMSGAQTVASGAVIVSKKGFDTTRSLGGTAYSGAVNVVRRAYGAGTAGIKKASCAVVKGTGAMYSGLARGACAIGAGAASASSVVASGSAVAGKATAATTYNIGSQCVSGIRTFGAATQKGINAAAVYVREGASWMWSHLKQLFASLTQSATVGAKLVKDSCVNCSKAAVHVASQAASTAKSGAQVASTQARFGLQALGNGVAKVKEYAVKGVQHTAQAVGSSASTATAYAGDAGATLVNGMNTLKDSALRGVRVASTHAGFGVQALGSGMVKAKEYAMHGAQRAVQAAGTGTHAAANTVIDSGHALKRGIGRATTYAAKTTRATCAGLLTAGTAVIDAGSSGVHSFAQALVDTAQDAGNKISDVTQKVCSVGALGAGYAASATGQAARTAQHRVVQCAQTVSNSVASATCAVAQTARTAGTTAAATTTDLGGRFIAGVRALLAKVRKAVNDVYAMMCDISRQVWTYMQRGVQAMRTMVTGGLCVAQTSGVTALNAARKAYVDCSNRATRGARSAAAQARMGATQVGLVAIKTKDSLGAMALGGARAAMNGVQKVKQQTFNGLEAVDSLARNALGQGRAVMSVGINHVRGITSAGAASVHNAAGKLGQMTTALGSTVSRGTQKAVSGVHNMGSALLTHTRGFSEKVMNVAHSAGKTTLQSVQNLGDSTARTARATASAISSGSAGVAHTLRQAGASVGNTIFQGSTAAHHMGANSFYRAKDMFGRAAERTRSGLCYGASCVRDAAGTGTQKITEITNDGMNTVRNASVGVMGAMNAGAAKAAKLASHGASTATSLGQQGVAKAKLACSLSLNGLQGCLLQAKDMAQRGGRAFMNGVGATKEMAQGCFATMGQSMSDMVYAIQPMLQNLTDLIFQLCQQISATLANSWHTVQALVYA